MNFNFTRIVVILLPIFLGFGINSYSQSEWIRTSTPPGGSISAIVTIGDNIFAGATSGGVYFSEDNGVSWTQRNGEFPNMEVLSLVVNGTDIYAGTGGSTVKVYKSNDNGLNWIDVTPSSFTANAIGIMSMVIDNNNIYIGAGDPDTGIYKSSLDNISISSWSSFNSGLVNKSIRSLKIDGASIYAGTYGDGVWVSPTDNSNWALTSSTMPVNSDYIQAIEVVGSDIFAGNISGMPVLYKSIDNGLNWVQSNTNIFNDEAVYAIKSNGNAIYVGTEGEGIFYSYDNGLTWGEFNEGFRDGSGNWFCNQINIRSITFSDSHVFAGSDCGVWIRSLVSLGINENEEIKIKITPNPVKDFLKISNLKQKSNYKIYDITGKVLKSDNISITDNNINVSDLAIGAYIIRIEDSNFKFLKI